jgi:hypothetical protein
MQKNVTRFWAAVLAVVVIIVAVVVWKYYGPTASVPGVPVYAPKGQLTTGFPKELILGDSSALAQSYTTNYSSSTNQYVAIFNSGNPIGLLYSDYTSYFAANGWTIANTTTPSSTLLRGLYAVKANAVAAVSIEEQGANRQVIVSYSLMGGTPSGVAVAPAAEKPSPNLVISSGTLNPSFPTIYLVDPAAKILSSSDNPDVKTGLRTTGVVFASGQSVDALYKQYLDLLSGKKWQITSKTDSGSFANILAKIVAGGNVTVQMQSGANGVTDVIVTVQQ